MNIQQIIQNLGIFTIGTVTVTTMLGFIAKSIFNNYLNKHIELYKFKLQHETEKFKSELKRQNTEYQIKFSTLHKDRADVIKQLHSSFINIRQELKKYNKSDELQKLPQELNPVLLKFHDLQTFFEANRLYFPKDLCLKIDEFLMRFLASAAMLEFFSKNRDKYKIARKDDPKEKELEQNEFFNMINDSEILKDLEDEFRSLIGVSEESTTANKALASMLADH